METMGLEMSGIVISPSSLGEVLKWVEDELKDCLSILEAEPRGHVRVYCPSCLYSFLAFRSSLRKASKRGGFKCPYCGIPMKLADSEYYTRKRSQCVEWYERSRRVLEKVFDELKSWGRFGIERVEVHTCRELEVVFDNPSHMLISNKGIELYLHWLSERDLDKLVKVIEAAKSLGMRLRIDVLRSLDHCTVDERKMAELGFKRVDFEPYYRLEVE
jgi:hypothetical protein